MCFGLRQSLYSLADNVEQSEVLAVANYDLATVSVYDINQNTAAAAARTASARGIGATAP